MSNNAPANDHSPDAGKMVATPTDGQEVTSAVRRTLAEKYGIDSWNVSDRVLIPELADQLAQARRERDELKADVERLRETVDYAAEQIAGLRADNTAWREEIDRLRAENERALDVCRRIVKQWDEEETVWVGCVEDARAVLAKHAEPQS